MENSPNSPSDELMDDDVVVTGLSGCFPNCLNIEELKEALINGANLLTSEERRWKNCHPEMPKFFGFVKNDLTRFDAGFFEIDQHQTDYMSPFLRLKFEHTIMALFDAGINPSELLGKRVAILPADCFNEVAIILGRAMVTHSWMGFFATLCGNKIGHLFRYNGISSRLDTACSTSSTAIDAAYRMMKNDLVDMAIIQTENSIIQANSSLQFARLGVLNKTDCNRVFDESSCGYNRAEAAGALILQKAKDAKRIYGKILYSKCNSDGYKDVGILSPSSIMQAKLLTECQEDCNLDAEDIAYIETHGTGTRVGDEQELITLDEAVAKRRKKPLLIGAVKANTGHTEATSGFVALVKVALMMECDTIFPTINVIKPRSSAGTDSGRLKIVTECMPLKDNAIIGINNFGFGGSNAHTIVQQYSKKKIIGGRPKDDLPRLVCISGRTDEAIQVICNDLHSRDIDVEYVALYHSLFRHDIGGHRFRGYTVLSKTGELTRSSTPYFHPSPLYLVFTSLGENWMNFAKEFMYISVFAESIQRTKEILLSKKINIMDPLKTIKNDSKRDIQNSLGNFAVLMALADLLRIIDLKPTKTSGFCLGEFIRLYYIGILTFEDAVLAAYDTVLRSSKTNRIAMARDVNNMNGIGQNIYSLRPEQTNGITEDVQILIGDDIPHNAVVCEIGLNKASKTKHVQSHYSIDEVDPLPSFIKLLGRLFECGQNLNLAKLYPEVKFPVSRGTPRISHLIKWNHEKVWKFIQKEPTPGRNSLQVTVTVDPLDQKWEHITGHVIDGRNLFSAAGYLCMVWSCLAFKNETTEKVQTVTFRNCRFLKATTIRPKETLDFKINIQWGSGRFEILHENSLVVSGYVNDDCPLANLCDSSKPNDQCIMTKKDIYKELKLRGYEYQNWFQGLQKCTVTGNFGYALPYQHTLEPFLDAMFQMSILNTDSRALFVPVYIDRLSIDPLKYEELEEKYGKGEALPIHFYRECQMIRSGGIEVHGIKGQSIPRRPVLCDPILQSYKFVEFEGSYPLEEAMRIIMQIIVENQLKTAIMAVELIDDETSTETPSLAYLVQKILEEEPLMVLDMTVLGSNRNLNLPVNFQTTNKSLSKTANNGLVIGSNLLQRSNILSEAFAVINDDGFVISRENTTPNPKNNLQGTSIVATYHTGTEYLVLLAKQPNDFKSTLVFKMPQNYAQNFTWIEDLQALMTKTKNILIVCVADSNCGILGFINCLRKEPYCKTIKCVLVMDEASVSSLDHDFYSRQIDKGLAVNICKNLKWGTYRHLNLNVVKVDRVHIFGAPAVRGDLNSLDWFEGPLQLEDIRSPKKKIAYVHYTALNFKDVLTASGRLAIEDLDLPRLRQDIIEGLEFAGIDLNGNRVAGLVSSGSLANIIEVDEDCIWNIPNDWTLEEAATVLVVYLTVITGLQAARLKRGESILIHCGAGGIGISAINLALFYGCKIFVTVGTDQKRQFLKEYFSLKDSQIGNSRDTTFREHIMQHTDGKGVDVVLNSLAEEKQEASIQCLGKGGRFIEIGKYDLVRNNRLRLLAMSKECSFHGIMLDALLRGEPTVKKKLFNEFVNLASAGAVKPLPSKIFEKEQLTEAFRYMANGQHIGKILIRMKPHEAKTWDLTPSPCVPRYFCDSSNSYIITGGLGGFGLELIDWLILRRARKIVAVSRNGIKTGYQASRIRLWRSYGVDVKISTADITNVNGCQQLMDEANNLGPVEGIFHLAVVLKDAIFENQTSENYRTVFEPKVQGAKNLDALSRRCSKLRKFVVFSTISCGRGNGGQTNYGMANSAMERICENRKKNGYPALAIQWGAVGDVGLVAEMSEKEISIGGTLQQKISSCLQVMDNFLGQEETIVSSMVVAEKKSRNVGGDLMTVVANILGICDYKKVAAQVKLPELGMNSMSAVEIKQTMERDFQILLSPEEVRNLTFGRLKEIHDCRIEHNATKETSYQTEDFTKMFNIFGIKQPTEEVSRLPSLVDKTDDAPTVFMFPGIEGNCSVFTNLASQLTAHCHVLQYYYLDVKKFDEMVDKLLQEVQRIMNGSKRFNFILYSFGTVPGLEIAHKLEQEGCTGYITCVDSSPDVITTIITNWVEAGNELETDIVLYLLNATLGLKDDNLVPKKELRQYKTYEEKVDAVMEALKKKKPNLDFDYQTKLAKQINERTKLLSSYRRSYDKLKSKIKLLKPVGNLISGLPNDYNLSIMCQNPVDVIICEGNHNTILEDHSLSENVDLI